MLNKVGILILVLMITSGLIYSMRGSIITWFFATEESVGVNEGINSAETDRERQVVAEGLDIPWELVFLPEGGILVTERSGRLLLINNGQERYLLDEVREVGEGGLLGMAIHPEFADNGYLYLYMTTASENRVDRYRFENQELLPDKAIIENIPRGRFHNGGRIKFGPDGYLYITTGDAQDPDLAQDRDSLAGKILRITADGNLPEGNPFGTEVFSYGHRNPQGLAWDDAGRLWSTEHGPRARDELNLIKAGNNYGWPEIIGNEEREGMVTPVRQSGDDHTWAPSGAIFRDGSIFFTGLRGSAIYEAKLEGEEVADFRLHFREEFGRLRAIREGPDGMFYLLTNNTDGRGTAEVNDDRLIKIDPMVVRE